MKNVKWWVITALGFALLAGRATAEDIDIYSSNTTITPGAPNVLIVLDNTANWSQSFSGSTKFDMEKLALAQVVNALNTQFNLGLMLFTETGSPNNNTDGGYVRFAIQAMTDSAGAPTNARNCLLTMVGGTPSAPCAGTGTTYYTNLNNDCSAGPCDKSNGGKAGVTMGEAYYYFAGSAAYAGNNKVKADPLAFTSGSIAGPTYKSPVATNECQKNFIIVINNGPFKDAASDTTIATTQLAGVGGSTAVINPPDNGTSSNNEADEWTRFLNLSDVQAITYTVEVGPKTDTQGKYNTALLQSMGRQGKGGYYAAIDAQTLLDALTRIFNDIQAVNSVFASASLPLSADNSGAFANQVYMGVFRPDSNGNPRWVGNLKQYKFSADTNGNLTFVGADNKPAGGASGFAQPNAVSFWTSKDTSKAPDAPLAAATSSTTGSTGGFYSFDSKGAGLTFDLPDGEWVEKGGAAQQLRLAYLGYGNRGGIGDLNTSSLNGKTARQVFTCTGSCLTPPSSGAAFTAFDSGNPALSSPATFGINTTISVSGITSTQSPVSVAAGTPPITGSLSVTASVVTINLSSTPSPKWNALDNVTISGSSVAGTNGTFTISGTSNGGKTILYAAPLAPNGSSATTVTAAKAGNTATVTMPASPPYNLAANATIVVAGANCNGSVAACPLNGTFTIASSPTPTATTFTYALPGVGVGATVTSGVTVASTRARVFADTTGYSNGDSVTIAGAACASGCGAYNGVFTISNVQTGSFDYPYTAASPLADAPGGSTVTATNTTSANTKLAVLLKWIRGQDTKDENGFKVAGANTDVRASIHGDVLHTRPVVINYGTPSTADNVYVFYGGNDGVFRAVKGGQLATDGNEQWAFIPQEFFAKFLRLYDNSPAVLYPSTPTGIVAEKRDYFWDGPVGLYVTRDSAGAVSKAIIYLAARRGGRFVYAIDVTTVNSPKVLWRKGCTSQTDNSTCDTGFAELGQTWSTPTVATVHNGTDAGRPVVFFGAGYDTAEDNEVAQPSSDTRGRAIYALDALTGALLWTGGQSTGAPIQYSANITFGIAADLLVSDKGQDGFADRIYAADLGGNVWRVDINDADMNNWKVWHIAAVGDRSSAATTRKFMFSPDVVFGDNFDAVVIGSGDREHPLDGGNASEALNRVYMFEDSNTGFTGGDLGATAGAGLTEADLQDVTGGDTVGPDKKGWFMDLLPGEKVINGPLVLLSGAMVFGTNQPDTSTTSCTGNLGIARRYDINYLTGAASSNGFVDGEGQPARFQVAAGGGFLPSPVSGVVEIDGQRYMFAIDNPLNGPPIPNTVIVNHDRFRTYWHEILE